MIDKRKPRCHNCKYAGQQFKLDKLTHLYCHHPAESNKVTKEGLDHRSLLQVFSDTCKLHEFKPKEK